MKLELKALCESDESAFRRAVEEFDRANPEMIFAFDFGCVTDFPAYVEMLRLWSEGVGLPERFVPNSYLLAWVGEELVGRVSIRHELNDFLSHIGGHIGYAVVPSWEGRGVATEMLLQALGRCAELGIERALVTCDTDNPASRRVIEKNGGVFDGISEDPDAPADKERYWIETENP